MAEIFLARPSDASLSKLVAVKRILPVHMEDPSFQEMFRREGSIALRFRHHAIITVHELGKVGRQQYMSMEFFPGKTLANIMLTLRENKSSLELLDKVLIIKNVAEALQYIHDFTDYGDLTEIIHRDISPHNIMVGFDGATKLIDFGIAKITSHQTTQSKSIKGKVAYMSPEQARGEPLTKQTDIFSLGIVLWELLAGRKLFTGKTIDEVTRKVIACNIPDICELKPEVPTELRWICEKALAPRAQNRYHSAAEFAYDLDAVLMRSEKEGHQKRLAKAVRSLFPEDHRHLKKILRQYEVSPEDSSPSQIRVQTPPPIEVVLTPPPLPFPKRSYRRSIAKLTPKQQTKWISGALAIAIIFASTLLIRTTNEPTVEPTPVPMPISVAPPSPAPAPAPVPAPIPAPIPAAKPKPVAVAPTQKVTPPKPAVAAKPPAPPPAAKVVTKPPAKKIQRNVAAKTPAVQSIAYLTVLAEPNTRILVNDKFAGTEVVNEIKVPAGKPVKVQVISTLTGVIQSKELTFKPFSRNVVEMNGTTP